MFCFILQFPPFFLGQVIIFTQALLPCFPCNEVPRMATPAPPLLPHLAPQWNCRQVASDTATQSPLPRVPITTMPTNLSASQPDSPFSPLCLFANSEYTVHSLHHRIYISELWNNNLSFFWASQNSRIVSSKK